MTFPSITNRGEFFSNHYLDTIIGGDLGDLRRKWDEAEKRGDSARSRIKGMGSRFFAARAAAVEAGRSTRADAVRDLNALVLTALGYTALQETVDLKRNTVDLVEVPVAAKVETSTGLLLVAVDAGLATDVDELFAEAPDDSASRLLERVWRAADNKAVTLASDAVGEIFATDDPPRYVLVLGGRLVLLAERSKWAEGRFLAVDFDAALERNDIKAKGELETIAALFSADALVPDGGQSMLDDLVDKSHKHAVGVSKELRTGIRESIEILANEVIQQRLASNKAVYEGPNRVDATELTRQCLRYLYRLIVLLYAESRPELGILPVNDQAYMDGYSLDRLRELTQVELDNDRARNGSHLDQSLTRLFELVNDGYHADHAQQALALEIFETDAPTYEEYLQFPGLDAGLFDPKSVGYLDDVTLRNQALQQVLRKLMLAEGRKAKDSAGFISYAQLGINQLGAVYEGLMAYSGFFADRDLYEVAKGGDPSDGTWMLPVEDADGYPDDVFVTGTEDLTGKQDRVRHLRGSFVFRMSGRDRQRSASYYTPEVLTRCVVKHALAELLGTDDYAPQNGSSGIEEGEATKILDLTICEPALGSGAFANEAINQLSAEYLKRRQAEQGDALDPETYNRELQKVKAHFALHQTYGADLNATAIELAEVSLWLNATYGPEVRSDGTVVPGLKAPWFGLQLRRGNSLIGCRRATWRASQLGDKPWANTTKGTVQPPVDRKLSEGPLDPDEIHHFLFPGHGWAAVANRKEAKELRPDEAKALKDWRKKVLAGPKKADAKRLAALAAAVESMWESAAELIRLTQRGLRRPIDVYGAPITREGTAVSRADAERALANPDSPLGRLRTLMDAWVGMWFWPLDTGVAPPTWEQWLQAVEELTRPDERHGLTGQLDLFDDLAELVEAQQRLSLGHATAAELRERFDWLGVAVDAAQREGAWHWDLEFAPAFKQGGGFDLQVGNPPWVRPRWYEDLVLAEVDPWWGITEKAPTNEKKTRRAANLAAPGNQTVYLAELASAQGVVEILGSPIERPVLAGIQTNLFMVFMDTVWRHLSEIGTAGLLHPESHFTDPKGATLRRATYGRLRRHYMFRNDGILFEDVHHNAEFGIHVYGTPRRELSFIQVSFLLTPDTVDRSLTHDGSGEQPGIQLEVGGWDVRPHRARVLSIAQRVLADWARLFDEPGTPAAEARLLRPVTTADLDALSVLAAQPVRLADHDYHWTRGHEEDRAKAAGIIRWETTIPGSWDDVILQGPHFTVATPFARQPNEDCRHRLDYSDWDLESLPERVIPRTNYQRATDSDTYDANLDHWDGEPYTGSWRVIWRRMTQPGLERSLHPAIVPPGPQHVNTVHGYSLPTNADTVSLAGIAASLVLDYLVKVSGKADVQDELARRFPLPSSVMRSALLLRTLRLNCLTADYAPLWEELWDPAWQQDRWTEPDFERLALGEVESNWSMATPLRRDFERRLALVELDALAALMLGLTAEQLCAMYRTQFAVLRKYEYKMAFDAEGRKLCGYHQSAGYRQAQLQNQAKAGDLPKEWSNLWKLYEQYEDDPSSVDWRGRYTPPFTRPDREQEMTRAYNAFQSRLDAGEYQS